MEDLLQRSLATRLNLQIALAQLPVLEEWMDIHVDRWLDNVPAPPEMPRGAEVAFAVVLGGDLRHVTWSAWGDPAGFVPKLANYFQLCQMSKQDMAVLDQLGNAIRPELVGSWLTVLPGRVVTGWQFCEPVAWSQLEEHFASHAAKLAVHQWLERSGTERVERFVQAIGDGAYSEVEIAMPEGTVAEQLASLGQALSHFGSGVVPAALLALWQGAAADARFAVAVRIAQGAVAQVSAIGPGPGSAGTAALAAAAQASGLAWDTGMERVVTSLSAHGVRRAALVQAGGASSLQLEVEPGDPADNPSRVGRVVVKAPAGSAN